MVFATSEDLLNRVQKRRLTHSRRGFYNDEMTLALDQTVQIVREGRQLRAPSHDTGGIEAVECRLGGGPRGVDVGAGGHSIPPRSLRGVERGVCDLEELFARAGVSGSRGNADAQRQGELGPRHP